MTKTSGYKGKKPPFLGFLTVPFFLVYFVIMIIPELIVGRFSDETVRKLDKMVYWLSMLAWSVIILIYGVIKIVL